MDNHLHLIHTTNPQKICLDIKWRCAFIYSSFLLKYFRTYCWKSNM